ncbi:MAG TPA: sensor histidine kinase [Anaerolineales bacterium]|nr:sensor histidine kinase [Anaerolineales bacterium]
MHSSRFRLYNNAMIQENNTLITSSRLLDIATYLAAIVASVLGLRGLPEITSQAVAIGLGIIFLLAHRFLFIPAKNDRQLSLYFGLQTAIIAGMLLLRSPSSDTFTFLFFLLAIHLSTAFPQHKTLVWVALFFIVDSTILFWARGITFTPVIFFNAAVFLVCIAFGLNIQKTEFARQENARMLEELRLAQRQVQDLAIANERNRLARDLHDSAKQQAFALSAQIDAARSLLQRDPTAADRHLNQAEQLADQLRQELATLILELRPSILGEQSLAEALSRYLLEWSQQSRIEAEFRVEDERAITRDMEHTLFRICQEALSNVSRHSQAERVVVTLDFRTDQVKLTVHDYGRGFEAEQTQEGVGTQSMRERAATLPAGTFTLDSIPGQGTVVTITARC